MVLGFIHRTQLISGVTQFLFGSNGIYLKAPVEIKRRLSKLRQQLSLWQAKPRCPAYAPRSTLSGISPNADFLRRI